LDTILSGINRLVERHALQSICSIWRVKEGRLNHVGESRLPEGFVRGFDGLQITSTGWPGARAANLGKLLTAENASTDILWEDYREPALSHHLLASCFVPIMAQSGGVLGILAAFCQEPHSADQSELALLEAASRLAAGAFEHQQLIDKLSEQPVQQTEEQAAEEGQAEIRVEIAPLTIAVVVGNRLLADQVEASLRGLPVQVVLESGELNDWPGFLERLERLRPEVLLADISLFKEGVEQAVRAIRSSPAAPAVVALHTAVDRELILTVVRAGAREYLYPPINLHLRNALQRILKDRETKTTPGHVAGKVLGFVSVKGGCGATTIACHISAELQRTTTQHVLLADFDVTAGMIRHLMKANSKYSVLDAASNTYRLDASLWKALVSNGKQGLDVMAGPAAPTIRSLPRDSNFRHILHFIRNLYDWVVVDLGRGLNSLTMAVLEEIDEVIVVTTPDIPALVQARLVVQSLSDEGFGRHRLHLVLNRDWKGALSPEELEQALGLPVYASIPFDGVDLDECYTKGDLVAPTAVLGKHYARLAAKLTGAPPPEKSKGFLPSLRLKFKL
jgi:pilus assembly protein CpaE